MSVSLKRRPKRETVRQGPAAVFNWGTPLPQKSMAEIAAMEPAAWETTTGATATTDPTPDLRASVAIELACYQETNYVLDDISIALDQLVKLIRPLAVAVPGEHHAARMLLTAYFAGETGAEAAAK